MKVNVFTVKRSFVYLLILFCVCIARLFAMENEPESYSSLYPLHVAAEAQDLPEVSRLLNAGLLVTSKDRMGLFPLYIAIDSFVSEFDIEKKMADNKAIVLLLVLHGADPLAPCGDPEESVMALLERLIREQSDKILVQKSKIAALRKKLSAPDLGQACKMTKIVLRRAEGIVKRAEQLFGHFKLLRNEINTFLLNQSS
jgi:hypothetical protein